ncbi:MarR family winged helix-turn-helix transcriptional regulator [Alloalcanivorax profundimaris]|jgi:DNA-binding MarR family transcriptional regulator|uniref:MarR family winged helix-turn-helix transcriptional regulator n=1 Tax=Alloalcanivorax profundimaris TaxID=2735259 RepID=UPI000C3F1F2E|nr:MarR family transcriptional regulator [Alloalcanivorax profundimaris]MAO59026.1 MarR family transcriptional regulator [Alcanivorax sp.]MCQ6263634.1 MarR family transcriptional regulator [Alcanivorax sp. MM125-6]QJX02376.1 MarR family transcriptional regulator [Alcanivorax sp. IO_7]MAY09932.1 MarR family transcriptional regulator [Alcanivorax sp.]MBF1801626.1 MarR family transcriptional regulator [Alloalcanivorax profundimaris]|tara:strand:+ start:348 stop:776 length:429 start_codon:yes stop_codon:yes gene_type:complete
MPHQADIRQVLWQLAFQFKVSSKRAIRDYDLPINGMHVRLLQMIHRQPDCTAQHIAAVTGRDKAQITRVIKELEAMDLVTRTPNPEDRRSQLLALSETGAGLMARIQEAEDDVKARLLKGIPKRDQDTFIEIGNRMLDNLRD